MLVFGAPRGLGHRLFARFANRFEFRVSLLERAPTGGFDLKRRLLAGGLKHALVLGKNLPAPLLGLLDSFPRDLLNHAVHFFARPKRGILSRPLRHSARVGDRALARIELFLCCLVGNLSGLSFELLQEIHNFAIRPLGGVSQLTSRTLMCLLDHASAVGLFSNSVCSRAFDRLCPNGLDRTFQLQFALAPVTLALGLDLGGQLCERGAAPSIELRPSLV